MSTIHRGCSIARICVLFLCLLDFHVSLDTWQRAPGSPAAIFNTEAWIPLMHVHETTYSDSQKPSSPVSKSWQDPAAQIFVGLVHYRDRRCSNTLSNIFSKAKYPDRVHVGEYTTQLTNALLITHLTHSHVFVLYCSVICRYR